MAPRLVLQPDKPLEQMTPAELRILALRGGAPSDDTDVTQVASEQAAPAETLDRLSAVGARFGAGDWNMGGVPGADVPGMLAYDQNLQNKSQDLAQTKRNNLLEALKSAQANRLAQQTQAREALALENSIQNTRFQQGIQNATTRQSILEGNRVPQSDRSTLASYDSAIQAAQNAMAQYDKSPTEFVGSTGAAFIPLVAAGLGPGGQATEEAQRSAAAAFPDAKDVAAGLVGIKTGRRKLENLIVDLANKRANLTKKLQGQQFGGLPNDAAAPVVVEERKGASGRIIQRMSDGTHRVKPNGG